MSSATSLLKNMQKQYSSLQNQLSQMSASNTKATFDYNAEQAQINRDWEAAMSNTSHQREVRDLKAAGLNPVLSANNGANSYTSASANASADTSAVNAIANSAIANLNNQTSLQIAKWNRQVGLASAAATRAAAASTAGATVAAASMNSAATQYAADMNYKSNKYKTDTSITSNPVGNFVKNVGDLIKGKTQKQLTK